MLVFLDICLYRKQWLALFSVQQESTTDGIISYTCTSEELNGLIRHVSCATRLSHLHGGT